MTTLYYDPQLDVHHRLPTAVNNTTAFYAAPQVPDDARALWDAACLSAGFTGELQVPIPAGRAYGSSLLLAREWGDTEMETRLADAIEASYEPTWDHERGEFTWGLGLDEEHPPDPVDLVVVATSIDQLAPTDPSMGGTEWTAPVIIDSDGQVAHRYGLSTFPSWVFVGGDGRVVWRGTGALSTEQLDQAAGYLLSSEPPAE